MSLVAPLRRAAIALLPAVLLAACAHGPQGGSRVQVWASSMDGARKLERQADLVPIRTAAGNGSPSPVGKGWDGGSAFAMRGTPTPNPSPAGRGVSPPTGSDPVRAEGVVLTLDPGKTDQTMVGFGAAMTDASAQLFQTALSPAQRKALFAELFGRQGLALNFLRVPIGASDFSARHYSLDDVPAGQGDPELRSFSMAEPQRFQIPMLKAAKRTNPDLVLMASPWSAPAWMKDSQSLIKGRLRRDAYPAYAAYFTRYLGAMQQAGLPVRYVSVQNEPQFEPTNYPGMRMTPAERAAFIGSALGPALAGSGTAILEWDHNWDHPEEPLGVLADPAARQHVTGVAWHCYGGDPKVMAEVRAAYPEQQLFLTECSGGGWSPHWGEAMGWMFDNLIVAPARAGSKGTILWNLALDPAHGPHLGGCGDCRGVVTIDPASGAVTRNLEYYVLGHASRFVRPGAVRIDSSAPAGPVNHVAFRNPDGTLVLLVHNVGKADLVLAIMAAGRAWALTMPAGEIMTLVWPAPGPAR